MTITGSYRFCLRVPIQNCFFGLARASSSRLIASAVRGLRGKPAMARRLMTLYDKMVHYDPDPVPAHTPPPVCPKCGSHRTQIVGTSEGGIVTLRCNNCGERSTVSLGSRELDRLADAGTWNSPSCTASATCSHSDQGRHLEGRDGREHGDEPRPGELGEEALWGPSGNSSRRNANEEASIRLFSF